MKYIILLITTLFTAFASNAFITPSELKKSLTDENLIIIDVSNKSLYSKGHIENSIHSDVSVFIDKAIYINPENMQNTDIKNKYIIAPSYTLENELRALGINSDSKVVIYDHNTKSGILNSSLLAFVLIYSGFDNVSILNGGYMAWVFENQILISSEPTKVQDYGNIIVKLNTDILVDVEDVNDSISKIKTLDARSPEEYFGIIKSNEIDRLGHIPYSSNSYYKYKFNTDSTLRCKEDLHSIYINGHELNKDDKVIIYADNIYTASMEWYIMYQEMGFKNTKLYQRSLLEWGNDEKYKLTRFKWE